MANLFLSRPSHERAKVCTALSDSGILLHTGNVTIKLKGKDSLWTIPAAELMAASIQDSFVLLNDSAVLKKYTNSGQLVLSKKIIFPFTLLHQILPLSDGYLISGLLASGGKHICYARLNRAGDTIWTRRFKDNFFGRHVRAIQTGDSGFLSLGVDAFYYDAYLVKTDKNGNLQWKYTFPSKYGDYYPSDFVLNCDSSVTMLGSMPFGLLGRSDALVMNIGGMPYVYPRCAISTSISGEQHTANENGMALWPNPTLGLVRLRSEKGLASVKVFDAHGRLMLEKEQLQADEAMLDLSDIANGLYLIQTTTKKHEILYTKLLKY